MSQAGQQFLCVVCMNPYDESLARFDNELQGPACVDCKRLLDWSHARLKVAKIGPCLTPGHNRLKP